MLAVIVAGATLVAAVVLVAARRKASEPEAEALDLGMAEAPEGVAGAGKRPGFVFGRSHARQAVHWTALIRIGLIVTLVASALAAALYYLGLLVKVQLDRVLGS
ncbi:MAG TPA: hypothetical protein VGB51_00630 [Actinomycetota bacterium]